VRFDHFSFQLVSYYKYKTKPLLSSHIVFSTCGKFRNVDCYILFLFHHNDNDNDKIQTEKNLSQLGDIASALNSLLTEMTS